MLKDKNIKNLPVGYDYYNEVMKKVRKVSKDTFKENCNDILEQRLYNLVINLCNQVIYDYNYTFTRDDLFLIADYNINIHEVIKKFEDDILKMKLSLK